MRPTRRPAPHRPLRGLRLLVEVALVAVIAIGLGGVVLGRVLPALGHPVFVVAGPSMEPAIGLGSAVVLETVPSDALRVGDVVSVRSGPARAVFTHRIERVAERDGEIWIATRGDANTAPDPSITPASAVIGRVSTVLPGAGYLLTFLSAPSGVAFVISTGLSLIVFGWWLDEVAYDRARARARSAATAGGSPTAVTDGPATPITPSPLLVPAVALEPTVPAVPAIATPSRPATGRSRSRELAAAREGRRATQRPTPRPSTRARRA